MRYTKEEVGKVQRNGKPDPAFKGCKIGGMNGFPKPTT